MSQPNPQQAEDIDIVAILKSDDAQCQRFDCSSAAVWAWRCPSCSTDRLVCDLHRRMFDFDNSRQRFVCSKQRRCGESIPNPVPWRTI